MARVTLLNEKWQPLIGIDIEEYALDNPGKVKNRAQTGTSGIADFPGEDEKANGFRAKITRSSGKAGDQATVGQTHLTVTADVTVKSPTIDPPPSAFPNPTKQIDPKQFSLDYGVMDWGTNAKDGVVYYWDNAALNWVNLGDALPTSDPGGGALWLSAT